MDFITEPTHVRIDLGASEEGTY